MAAIDQIRKRLAEQHDIVLPADTELVRSHAGWAMKAAGAWSWSLWSKDLPRGYGSQIPALDVLKCRNWSIDTTTHDMTIDPCRHCCREGFGACKTPPSRCTLTGDPVDTCDCLIHDPDGSHHLATTTPPKETP